MTPVLATAAGLALAHAIADFHLQPDRWIATKSQPLTLLKHAAVVLALSLALLGTLHWAVFALALAHLAIDAAKAHLGGDGPAPFLLDQAAHAATIATVALAFPALWAAGLWPALLPAEIAEAAPRFFLGLAGFIATTQAGGYAVGLLMKPYRGPGIGLPDGLPEAGRTIGWLERALIFLMVMMGQPTAIGFLIAAKSILRFDVASKGRDGDAAERARSQGAGEYVIIGTLASFGWALAASYATLRLLEIAAATP